MNRPIIPDAWAVEGPRKMVAGRTDMPLAERRARAYMLSLRAAWCVGPCIPGALSILKGAVPGRTRGSGHMAPTYIVGFPGSKWSDGQGGSLPFSRAGVAA